VGGRNKKYKPKRRGKEGGVALKLFSLINHLQPNLTGGGKEKGPRRERGEKENGTLLIVTNQFL